MKMCNGSNGSNAPTPSYHWSIHSSIFLELWMNTFYMYLALRLVFTDQRTITLQAWQRNKIVNHFHWNSWNNKLSWINSSLSVLDVTCAMNLWFHIESVKRSRSMLAPEEVDRVPSPMISRSSETKRSANGCWNFRKISRTLKRLIFRVMKRSIWIWRYTRLLWGIIFGPVPEK